MKTLLLALPLLVFAVAANAQERTAAGAVDTQMTWSALTQQINAVSTKVDGVNSRIDQSVVCGKKGKIYAPGATGADAQGCVEATTTSGTSLTTMLNTLNNLSSSLTTTNNNVTNTVNCAKSGYFFNGASCVAPASSLPSGTMCGATSYSTETGKPLVFRCQGIDPKNGCPSGYSQATAPIWGGKNGQTIGYCFKN